MIQAQALIGKNVIRALSFWVVGFKACKVFGGVGKFGRLKNMAHRLLQVRFRRMGENSPHFKIIDVLAKKITHQQNRAYDLDVLRQSITLAFLKKHLPVNSLCPNSMVCVIGDGFASMTALLLASQSAGRVVLINLSKTLLVDLWYLRLWMGAEIFEKSVDLVSDESGLNHAMKIEPSKCGMGRIIAIQAAHHELLQKDPVDLAINTASMQEMNPAVIEAYFRDLRAISKRRELFFYSCNREEKILPDGTVTRFSEYPWHAKDQIIVDALCPWHQEWYILSSRLFLDPMTVLLGIDWRLCTDRSLIFP
jgi:hypothetical protein